MDVGYALRRAWEISWRHKVLWLPGFLVGLGTVGVRAGVGCGVRWDWPVRALPPDAQRMISELRSGPYFTVALVTLALLVLGLGVGLALLGALGRASLVDQVRAAEERGAVDLRAGWQMGGRHLWPVFFIRLLLGVPAGVVALAGLFPVAGTTILIAGQDRPEVVIPGVLTLPISILACLFPAVCLAALLTAPLGVLRRLAVRACVLEGIGVQQSVIRAWAMLRDHLGPLTLVWLALLGVGIGMTIVISLPLALVAVSLAAVALLTVFVSPLPGSALVLVTGTVVYLVGAAFSGVVEAFGSAVWTLAYRELTGSGLTGEEAAWTE